MNKLFIGFFVSRQQPAKGALQRAIYVRRVSWTQPGILRKYFKYYLLFSTPIASAFLFISTTSAPFDAKTVAMAFSSKA